VKALRRRTTHPGVNFRCFRPSIVLLRKETAQPTGNSTYWIPAYCLLCEDREAANDVGTEKFACQKARAGGHPWAARHLSKSRRSRLVGRPEPRSRAATRT
jgi:hypothetical protein